MPKIKKDEKPVAPSGLTLPEFIKLYKKLETKKKKAEAVVEECKSLIFQISTQRIPPMLEQLDTDEVNVPDVGRIELSNIPYPNILKADIPAFYKWLRDAGHGAMIVPYVFPQTLKAFVAEQLEQNRSLPDVCKVTFVPTAKLLKARKRGK